ncbi:MAG: sigma-70 family RNA polymerase sigma factor [Verrucomicrobiota bacterium]|nr:sigma-70 family RNA polymerase sigma factor [Verrucomicrobiota bacterium]
MIDCAASIPIAVDNRETFLRLLAQHDGIIHKVAAGYSSSLADRHDLMQEIRLQLWRAYPRYAPDRPFSTWMYRIALNVAISFLRKNSRPARQTVPLEELVHEVPNESSVSPQVDERIAILQQVIAALDPLDRALLVLYLDEHSYRAIAEILGLSETNVATKISRLKQRVRRDIISLNA